MAEEIHDHGGAPDEPKPYSAPEPPCSAVTITLASDPTLTVACSAPGLAPLSSRRVRMIGDRARRDHGGSPTSTTGRAHRLLEEIRALAEELEQLRADREELLADRDALLSLFGAVERRLARSRSTARLPRTPAAPPTVRPRVLRASAGERLRIDRESATCHIDGTAVPLAPREFRLLLYLLDHEGQDLRLVTLLREVWADSGDARTLRVHINALRKKLEPFAPAPIRILTLHRVGYRLDRVREGEE